MARRKTREGQGLSRVLGLPALFSTAYGNVGSSICYALGVAAAWALGVTPLVFLLTGLLFVTTAWSYAEATAMQPEAGGSSSFTRRAFNELASFGVGRGLVLDHIVTIAISASCRATACAKVPVTMARRHLMQRPLRLRSRTWADIIGRHGARPTVHGGCDRGGALAAGRSRYGA